MSKYRYRNDAFTSDWMSVQELQQCYAAGVIPDSAQVQRSGAHNWIPVTKVRGLPPQQPAPLPEKVEQPHSRPYDHPSSRLWWPLSCLAAVVVSSTAAVLITLTITSRDQATPGDAAINTPPSPVEESKPPPPRRPVLVEHGQEVSLGDVSVGFRVARIGTIFAFEQGHRDQVQSWSRFLVVSFFVNNETDTDFKAVVNCRATDQTGRTLYRRGRDLVFPGKDVYFLYPLLREAAEVKAGKSMTWIGFFDKPDNLNRVAYLDLEIVVSTPDKRFGPTTLRVPFSQVRVD